MFKAGQSGNPKGRPKGTGRGRMQVLAALDDVLARKKTLEKMTAELNKAAMDNPVEFFKTVVMPLLPRDAKLSVVNDGIVMWRNLLGQDVRAEDVGSAGKRLVVGTPQLQEKGESGRGTLPARATERAGHLIRSRAESSGHLGEE